MNDSNEAFIIPYINKLNFHTISEEGFDLDIKINALTFFNKLSSKYNDYLLALYEPFNKNINTIASSPICQIVLEKLLLIIDLSNTPLLFHNILNNLHSAKKCVLSSLINQRSSINYKPCFEEIIKLRILQFDNSEEVKNYST